MKLDMTYEDTWNTRTIRLAELGIGSYADYLSSEHWLLTRSKAKSRPNYKSCEVCRSKEVHLHHSSYRWIGTKYELRSVNAFCDLHHKLIHELAKETGVSVRLCTNIVRDPLSELSKSQILEVNEYFFEAFNLKRHILGLED